jgi:hypothetical protein
MISLALNIIDLPAGRENWSLYKHNRASHFWNRRSYQLAKVVLKNGSGMADATPPPWPLLKTPGVSCRRSRSAEPSSAFFRRNPKSGNLHPD